MKKSRWRFLKNKWLIALVVILAVVIAAIWASGGNKAPTFEWAAAEVGNVLETVSVTGA